MINTRPNLYFTLGGIPSATPGWQMTNLLELTKSGKRRGSDPLIIPGATGAVMNPLRTTVTERVLNGQVFGGYDSSGHVNTSEIEGLRANLDALVTAWTTIPGTADSTLTLVLHQYGSADLSGPVQVLDFDWDYAGMPVVANCILRLQLPLGELS